VVSGKDGAFRSCAGSISGDLVWTLPKMGHNGTNVEFEEIFGFAVQRKKSRYNAGLVKRLKRYASAGVNIFNA
jgi:hypothetical protein